MTIIILRHDELTFGDLLIMSEMKLGKKVKKTCARSPRTRYGSVNEARLAAGMKTKDFV